MVDKYDSCFLFWYIQSSKLVKGNDISSILGQKIPKGHKKAHHLFVRDNGLLWNLERVQGGLFLLFIIIRVVDALHEYLTIVNLVSHHPLNIWTREWYSRVECLLRQASFWANANSYQLLHNHPRRWWHARCLWPRTTICYDPRPTRLAPRDR